MGTLTRIGAALLGACVAVGAENGRGPADLRLIPFPKEIRTTDSRFALEEGLRIGYARSDIAEQAVAELRAEIAAMGGVECPTAPGSGRGEQPGPVVWLGTAPPAAEELAQVVSDLPESPEGYWLVVKPRLVLVAARQDRGLLWGVQVLRQLVRANLRDGALPCLEIRDWPSIRYRGFQDDLTRGPSTKYDVLVREVRTGSLLRLNFFTYYLEHQFEHVKNPAISPRGGCLTQTELRSLVRVAQRFGVEIIGNQQSFAHFHHILKHEAYKPLAELPHVLNPTVEGTYKLLDEMYSEQIPLLESPFFNVCCDETQGLGTGPARAVAERVGPAGLYTMHIRRVHELVTKKYRKRMMMWGDIILAHPDHLAQIPRDVVMLSWGYHPAESFEAAILPFAKSGYEFFVCPGTSGWSRILPDFGAAVVNIRNYIRDGARHGTLGVLNTTWDDDGESLYAPNWHGIAWGAECAWNGSAVPYEDFNRRLGGVLFGEPGDHFGRAIDLLGRAHRLEGFDGMTDGRFWKHEFASPVTEAVACRQAQTLLALVDPAIAELEATRAAARVNADWLDFFLFGARRMRLIATRTLDQIEAAKAYAQAVSGPTARRKEAVAKARSLVEKVRNEHAVLRQEYAALWCRENKPYALENVLGRYDALIAQYDKTLAVLDQAGRAVAAEKPLPPPREAGLELTP